MPAKVPQFGAFTFSESNGIYNARMREVSPAERDLTIMGRAGTSGMSILRGRRKGKTIAISGIVLKESQSEFITAIRTMAQLLMAESGGGVPTENLQFVNDEGTWIYEDAVLLNPDNLFNEEEAHMITWVPFTAIFFCPTGIARSATLTTVNFNNITSVPNTDSITIGGTVAPDTLIAITFDLVSTIDEFTFTNTTTNESITVTGLIALGIANDAVVYIDPANGEVRLNATKIAFNGIFPTFLPGSNRWQLTVAGVNNITEEQTSYDDTEKVYGDKQVSQEFTAGNEDIAQIALFLQKVEGTIDELTLYDDFSDPTIDPDKWGTSGNISVVGGRMRFGSKFAEAGTNNKTVPDPPGEPITKEAEWYQEQVSSNDAAGGTMWFSVNDGVGAAIQVHHNIVNGTMFLALTGAYGSGTKATWGERSGTMNIKQVGSDIEVRHNGILRYTIVGKTFQTDSFLIGQMNTTNTANMDIGNVKVNKTVAANTNEDLDVEIQGDAAGKPDGSAIANGTLAISASLIGLTYNEIIAAFATDPTLVVATIYHLVVKQSGGDVNNYYNVRKNTVGGYGNGTLETSSDGGLTWTNVVAEDLYFKLWTPLPSSINIDVAMSYYLSHYAAI